MSDPRNRGAAAEPPTKGEGCLRRFDPDAVSDAHGADFSAAAGLWQALQTPAENLPATSADGAQCPAEGQ